MEIAPENTLILVVDDEPENLELLQLLLKTQGYRTEAAVNAAEALAVTKRAPPDLILLDLWMPGVNGLDLCRHLRANTLTAQVPILIITGRIGADEKEQALAAGADDYVTKPVDRKDLLKRVQSLLRVGALNRELDRTLAEQQHLDAAREALEPAAPPTPPPDPTAPAAAGAESLHVLVVDDERLIRTLYTDLLKGAGYRVTATSNVAEAVATIPGGVDVILLDVMMPEVSGLDALEEIRASAPDVPVLILTAYQTAQNAIAALRGGAFDFIMKGMKPDVLLRAVARAAEQRRMTLEHRHMLRDLRDQLDSALRLLEDLRARLEAALAAPRVPPAGPAAAHTERAERAQTGKA